MAKASKPREFVGQNSMHFKAETTAKFCRMRVPLYSRLLYRASSGAALVVYAIFLNLQAGFANPNLITNGTFASGNGWTSGSCGANAPEISNNPGNYGIPNAPVGTHFAEVECDNMSPTSTSDYLQQTLTTIASRVFVASIQATTRAQFNVGDKMIIYGAGTNIASVTTTNAWVAYVGNFLATTTSSVVRYASNGSVSGSDTLPGDSVGLMVDDAQVQQLAIVPNGVTIAENATANFTTFQVATNTQAATLTVVLSAASGNVKLASTTGLTITSGANNSPTITFTGTAAAINTALAAGVSYKPTLGFSGNDTITFNVTGGAATDAPTVPIVVTPLAATVAVRKITTGGVGGPFSFTQTNLASNPASITTVTAGTATPAAPTAVSVTAVNTAITITEAATAGFGTSSASCTDANTAVSGNPGSVGTLSGSTITILAANSRGGAQITCTFTNATASPNLSIAKTFAPSGPFSVGQTVTYTYVITNTGNVFMNNVKVKDLHGAPAVQVSLGAGGITGETLSTAGPYGGGASTNNVLNDGIWDVLPPGAAVTFTWAHTVTQAEIDHG